jgi:hypothetical protein
MNNIERQSEADLFGSIERHMTSDVGRPLNALSAREPAGLGRRAFCHFTFRFSADSLPRFETIS